VGTHRCLAVALVLAACVLLAPPLAGCGGSTPGVSQRLKDANAHLKRFGEQIAAIREPQKQLTELDGQQGPETASKITSLLSVVRGKLEAALEEVRQAGKDLQSAAKMKISDNMKNYLDIEIEASKENEKALVAELDATDLKLKNVAETGAQAPLSAEQIDKLKSISELEDQSRQHAEKAAALHKKANDYYESKRLGK
jgi:hypothetical protein